MKPTKFLWLGLFCLVSSACHPKAPPAGTRRGSGGTPADVASGLGGTGGTPLGREAGGGSASGMAGATEMPGEATPATDAKDDETDRRRPSEGGATLVADAAIREVGAGGDAGDAGNSPAVVKYNVYLGQTHAHSDLSRATHDEFPGMDMPAAGFVKAKAKGADFYFITDHVDSSGSITPKDFQTIKAAALAATDATFVAAAGIEYHLDANEVNMYASDYDAAHTTVRRSSPNYLDYLMGRPGAFVQWNHPTRSGLPEQRYEGLTPARDRIAALVEVLNGDDTPAAASYQKALDLGWHVAPAAGHDNHGDGWFELPTRTGVLATSLTRDEIFEAIRQQRVYCSQDPGWKIWYELNGSIMGTTIAPGATYRASVKVEGGGRITKIEIVSKGGAVVAAGVPTAGSWSSDIPAQAGNFYYVRLTGSSNSVRAWTAPVWINGP